MLVDDSTHSVSFNLVLLDLRAPLPDVSEEKHGIGFVRAMPISSVPVVVLCLPSQVALARKCVIQGAQNYLVLPLTLRVGHSLRQALAFGMAMHDLYGEETTMDDFERVRVLGRGAQGQVILAKRKATGQLVAIKQISIADRAGTDRANAVNETKLMRVLQHPNIAAYYSSFADNGGERLNILIEYVDGGSLRDQVESNILANTLIPEATIMRWLVQCLTALQFMHSKNILHRDLKTANVFLSSSGLVKVGDLGISRGIASGGFANTACGTPESMSPEICANKPYNAKTDVWSLGCVLYELATLRRPFDGKTIPEIVTKIRSGKYRGLHKSYSKELKILVHAMLQVDVANRADVEALLAFPYVQSTLKKLDEELPGWATLPSSVSAPAGGEPSTGEAAPAPAPVGDAAPEDAAPMPTPNVAPTPRASDVSPTPDTHAFVIPPNPVPPPPQPDGGGRPPPLRVPARPPKPSMTLKAPPGAGLPPTAESAPPLAVHGQVSVTKNLGVRPPSLDLGWSTTTAEPQPPVPPGLDTPNSADTEDDCLDTNVPPSPVVLTATCTPEATRERLKNEPTPEALLASRPKNKPPTGGFSVAGRPRRMSMSQRRPMVLVHPNPPVQLGLATGTSPPHAVSPGTPSAASPYVSLLSPGGAFALDTRNSPTDAPSSPFAFPHLRSPNSLVPNSPSVTTRSAIVSPRFKPRSASSPRHGPTMPGATPGSAATPSPTGKPSKGGATPSPLTLSATAGDASVSNAPLPPAMLGTPRSTSAPVATAETPLGITSPKLKRRSVMTAPPTPPRASCASPPAAPASEVSPSQAPLPPSMRPPKLLPLALGQGVEAHIAPGLTPTPPPGLDTTRSAPTTVPDYGQPAGLPPRAASAAPAGVTPAKKPSPVLSPTLSRVSSAVSLTRAGDLPDLRRVEDQAMELRAAVADAVKDRGLSLFGLGMVDRRVIAGADLLAGCRRAFPSFTMEESQALCIQLLASSLLQPVSEAGEYLNADSDSSDSEDDEDDGPAFLRGDAGFALSPAKSRRRSFHTEGRAVSTSSTSGLSKLMRGHHMSAIAFKGESETFRFLCDCQVRPWNMVRGCLLPPCGPVALSINVREAARALRKLRRALRPEDAARFTGWSPDRQPASTECWARAEQPPIPEGMHVDTEAAVRALNLFEAAVRQLQRVRIHALPPAHLQVFFLNVYNAMVEHAFLRMSVPVDSADLPTFRAAVRYRIARMDFTLEAIHHVVFRDNATPPGKWLPHVSASDPRAAFATPADPRLLLLTADAVLPPPEDDADMPTFTTRGVSRQLDAAVERFCSRTIRIDERRRKVFLPLVFRTYHKEFAKTQPGLIEWLQPYVGGALNHVEPTAWTVSY